MISSGCADAVGSGGVPRSGTTPCHLRWPVRDDVIRQDRSGATDGTASVRASIRAARPAGMTEPPDRSSTDHCPWAGSPPWLRANRDLPAQSVRSAGQIRDCGLLAVVRPGSPVIRYGWNRKQFVARKKLWFRESSWNYKAVNRSSGFGESRSRCRLRRCAATARTTAPTRRPRSTGAWTTSRAAAARRSRREFLEAPPLVLTTGPMCASSRLGTPATGHHDRTCTNTQEKKRNDFQQNPRHCRRCHQHPADPRHRRCAGHGLGADDRCGESHECRREEGPHQPAAVAWQGTSPLRHGEVQPVVREELHAIPLRLGQEAAQEPRQPLEPRVRMEPARAQRFVRRPRDPAGPARLEDGHSRQELAQEPGDPDQVGSFLHQGRYGTPNGAWKAFQRKGWY